MINNSLVSYKESFWICVAALFCLISITHAKDFTGKEILSVKVVYTGAKTVDEVQVLDLISVSAGKRMSPYNPAEDLHSLLESGAIDDVQMYGEERGHGVDLVLELHTRPMLADVLFKGEAAFSRQLLAKQVELKSGDLISDSVIFHTLEKLAKYYHDSGYQDAVVTHRIQNIDKPEYANLILTIDEGEKVEDWSSVNDDGQKEKVHSIQFIGNNMFVDRVLKGEMKTKEKDILSFITKSGEIDELQLKEDEERILNFYRENGYLEAKSLGFKRKVDNRGKLSLVMEIQEGQKYQLRKVALAGKMTAFKPEDLISVLRMNAGVVLSLDKVHADIRTIRNYYGSKGYADASVEPEINDAGQGLIDLTYRISEGKPYKVGRIIIEGNNKTLDRVIRSEIPLKPDDNFNTVDVETTRKRLLGLNYFTEVTAEGRSSGQKGYRDIVIKVNEKNTRKMHFGLGYSTIDSFVGYMAVEETNFDISDPWEFRGAGQRLGLNLRIGSEIQDWSLIFTEPWFLGRRLSLGTEIFYKEAKNLSNYYDQGNVGVAVFLRKSLGDRSRVNSSLSYENIRVDVEKDLPETSLFQSAAGHYTRPGLNISYEYDSRDSVQLPRRGHKVEAGMTYVFEALGAESDSFIFNLTGRKYKKLWYDSILEVGGELTTVETDGGVTPIYDRKFLGGYRNLRGFEYRDVGPRDPATGGVIGGDSMAYATCELSAPLVSKLRGAIFYDVGFVNIDSWDFNPNNYHSDAGVGLRMRLPFGPIAFDYAVPLSSPDAKASKGGQFNFYLDYEF